MWQMIKIMNDNSRGNKIMHQLNEEVRCLRQSVSHLRLAREYANDIGDYDEKINELESLIEDKLNQLEDMKGLIVHDN